MAADFSITRIYAEASIFSLKSKMRVPTRIRLPVSI